MFRKFLHFGCHAECTSLQASVFGKGKCRERSPSLGHDESGESSQVWQRDGADPSSPRPGEDRPRARRVDLGQVGPLGRSSSRLACRRERARPYPSRPAKPEACRGKTRYREAWSPAERRRLALRQPQRRFFVVVGRVGEPLRAVPWARGTGSGQRARARARARVRARRLSMRWPLSDTATRAYSRVAAASPSTARARRQRRRGACAGASLMRWFGARRLPTGRGSSREGADQTPWRRTAAPRLGPPEPRSRA